MMLASARKASLHLVMSTEAASGLRRHHRAEPAAPITMSSGTDATMCKPACKTHACYAIRKQQHTGTIEFVSIPASSLLRSQNSWQLPVRASLASGRQGQLRQPERLPMLQGMHAPTLHEPSCACSNPAQPNHMLHTTAPAQSTRNSMQLLRLTANNQ